MSILDEIADQLTNEGVVGGADGWIVAKAFEPPTPDTIITIYETGGGAPDQTDGTRYDIPTIQVRLRGDAYGYELAKIKMNAVFDALNDATITGYTYIYSAQSGPIALGHDVNTRPIFTMNFIAMRERS